MSRKAEDYPLMKPTLGDNPPEEGSAGYEAAMKSLDIAMEDYNAKLEKWLKEEPVDGIDVVDGVAVSDEPVKSEESE